jgi:hypothetical protein
MLLRVARANATRLSSIITLTRRTHIITIVSSLLTAHPVCSFTFIFATIQMTVRRPPVRASPSVTVTNSSHSRRVYAVVTQIIVKASRNESMEQANFFGIGVV